MASLAFSRSTDTKLGTTAKVKQKSGVATSLPRKAKRSAAETNSTTATGAGVSAPTLTAEEKSTLAAAYKIYRDADFGKAAETIKELESKLSVPAVAALDLRLKFIEQSSAALNRCYAEVESGDKNTAIEKVLHFYWKQDDELSAIWNDQIQSAEMCEMLGDCFNDVYSLPIRFIGEENASQETLAKARACFRRCLELDQTNAIAHARLAFAAFKKEGKGSADLMEHLIKALENSPEHGIGLSFLWAVIAESPRLKDAHMARIRKALKNLKGKGKEEWLKAYAEASKLYREQERLAMRVLALGRNMPMEFEQRQVMLQKVIWLLNPSR